MGGEKDYKEMLERRRREYGDDLTNQEVFCHLDSQNREIILFSKGKVLDMGGGRKPWSLRELSDLEKDIKTYQNKIPERLSLETQFMEMYQEIISCWNKRDRYKPREDVTGCKVIYHGDEKLINTLRLILPHHEIILFDNGKMLELCEAFSRWVGIDSIRKDLEELKQNISKAWIVFHEWAVEKKFYQEAISAWDAYQKSKSLEEKTGK